MWRSLLFVVKIAVLVTAAVWLANRPGAVTLEWLGYRIDTTVGVLLLAAVIVGIVAALLYRFWRLLLGAPSMIGHTISGGRQRRGYKALTQGMVAVAAGDVDEAQKWARKADSLLKEPPLTMLLSAQAAQLDGDEQAAKRYFEAMLNSEETRFLGLRGLVMQAMRDGDQAAALDYTKKAYHLRPKTPWVLEMLFDLSERSGDLQLAERAIKESTKRRLLPAPEAARKRAVLHVEAAREAQGRRDRDAALKFAKEAHKLAPDLAPATTVMAEILIDLSRGREAAKLLERSWPHSPHPSLVAVYKRVRGGSDGIQSLKNLGKLVAGDSKHPEGLIALAEAALEAQLWGEARRYLSQIAAKVNGGEPDERVCRLMARLEEAEHGDTAKAHEWLLRAGSAAADPAWVCNNCGAVADDWAPRCGACQTYDGLRWTTPPRVVTPAEIDAMPAGDDAPALPDQRADGAETASLPVPGTATAPTGGPVVNGGAKAPAPPT